MNDERTVKYLCESNEGLIGYALSNYADLVEGLDYDWAISEAYWQLFLCARRYDDSQHKFSTYYLNSVRLSWMRGERIREKPDSVIGDSGVMITELVPARPHHSFTEVDEVIDSLPTNAVNKDTMKMLARGYRSSDVARKHGVSRQTIGNQKTSIRQSVGGTLKRRLACVD